MFRKQWVREQHHNFEFIIRMRQLTAKMDDGFLESLTTSDIEKLIAFWFAKLSKSVGEFQRGAVAKKSRRKSSVRLLLLTADEVASIFVANFFKCCTVTKSKLKNVFFFDYLYLVVFGDFTIFLKNIFVFFFAFFYLIV